MKKELKLYNMIFPIFILEVFNPLFIASVLIGNFLIDFLVLTLISFIFMKKFDRSFLKKYVYKVWPYGLLADLIGVGWIVVAGEIGIRLAAGIRYLFPGIGNSFLDEIITGAAKGYWGDIYYNAFGVMFIMTGVIVAGIAIFRFNYFRVLNHHLSFTERQRKIACGILAVLTAPYTFLLSNSFTLGH